MNASKHSYLFIITHLAIIAVVTFMAVQLNIVHLNFGPIALPLGDASWYQSIALDGYSYFEDKPSSVGFFPLFPLIWRYSHLSSSGITILNVLLLVCSLFVINREFKLNVRETMLTCSSMGLFYCCLPFSESVFLITSLILLIGYKRDNLLMICAGLFLASLTRTAAITFIPAIIVTETLNCILTQQPEWKKFASRTLLFIAVCCVAILVVALLQWHESGYWFVFAKAQMQWGKKFHSPTFPLHTWDYRILFFDASALIVGLLCAGKLTGLAINWLKKERMEKNGEYHFSIAYLFMVTAVSLFFAVRSENVTFINSLNRYIFGTSFFLVFMTYHFRENTFSVFQFAIFSFIVLAGLGMTGYFGNPYSADQMPTAILDAIAIFGSFGLYYWARNKQFSNLAFVAIYVLQTILQIHLFELYLKPSWVG